MLCELLDRNRETWEKREGLIRESAVPLSEHVFLMNHYLEHAETLLVMA